MKEVKDKRIERAHKFGLITRDVVDARRQERAVKFGLEGSEAQPTVNKAELDEKRQSRAIRFAGQNQASKEEDEERKLKRLHRFISN